MNGKINFLSIVILSSLISCNKKSNTLSKEYIYDFNDSLQGWQVLFSDYPKGEEDFYELKFSHTTLPSPLNSSEKALKVSGNNHSDDLLSIIHKKIEGLLPNTRYSVSFNIDFASNTCIACIGVGGSPDLSLGAGGLPYLPMNSLDNLNHYRPNFLVEIQGGRSNSVMKVLGKIGTNETITNPIFKLANRNNQADPLQLVTNSKGELWIMVGIDSGFEATTTLYYRKIKVTLTRI